MPSQRQQQIINNIKRRREFLQKSGARIPRKLRKKVPRGVFPKLIQVSYYKSLSVFVDLLKRLAQENIVKNLPAIIQQYKQETGLMDNAERTDAYGKVISDEINNIRIGFLQDVTDDVIAARASEVATRTNVFNREQTNRQIKAILGVTITGTENYLNPVIDSFVESNVSLIKTIPEQFFSKLETVIRQGVTGGEKLREIMDNIQNIYDVTDNRARLIARDQVQKLNSELTMFRQREAGVDEYTWSTSLDEKVRPTHAAKEGLTFKWNAPPADTGHPGSDINCRCVALPKFDKFFE